MSFIEQYRRLVGHGDKRLFLDLLDNNLTFASTSGQLEVCYLNKATGEASKWHQWKAIRDDDWWVARINNRLIAKEEIILDMDPDKNETQDTFFSRCQIQNAEVEEKMLRVLGTFTTGSRGIHIHLLYPELHKYSPRHREGLRAAMIKSARADMAKSTERVMIALEGTSHWKTGGEKVLLW